MHAGDELPQVYPETLLSKALLEMTSKGFGMTTVVDHKGALLGVFTDGDLRRVIDQKVELDTATMNQVMSRRPKTVAADTLAAEALRIMEDNKITALVVEDESHHPIGLLHMHDILRAGVI